MKRFGMRYTPEASRLLSKLHPVNKKLLRAALEDLRNNPYAGSDLQEELYGYKSFKLKRYRVLSNINEEKHTIQIFHIGHRKDVYEQFHRLLTDLKKSS